MLCRIICLLHDYKFQFRGLYLTVSVSCIWAQGFKSFNVFKIQVCPKMWLSVQSDLCHTGAARAVEVRGCFSIADSCITFVKCDHINLFSYICEFILYGSHINTMIISISSFKGMHFKLKVFRWFLQRFSYTLCWREKRTANTQMVQYRMEFTAKLLVLS